MEACVGFIHHLLMIVWNSLHNYSYPWVKPKQLEKGTVTDDSQYTYFTSSIEMGVAVWINMNIYNSLWVENLQDIHIVETDQNIKAEIKMWVSISSPTYCVAN